MDTDQEVDRYASVDWEFVTAELALICVEYKHAALWHHINEPGIRFPPERHNAVRTMLRRHGLKMHSIMASSSYPGYKIAALRWSKP